MKKIFTSVRSLHYLFLVSCSLCLMSCEPLYIQPNALPQAHIDIQNDWARDNHSTPEMNFRVEKQKTISLQPEIVSLAPKITTIEHISQPANGGKP